MFRKRSASSKKREHWLYRRFSPIRLRSHFLSKKNNPQQEIESLIHTFAGFVCLEKKITQQDADVALDLLRHAYPDTDHAWLARRLRQALKKKPEFEQLAKKLKLTFTQPQQVTTLGLQLFFLLETSKQFKKNRPHFLQFMRLLDAENIGEAIVQECCQVQKQTKKKATKPSNSSALPFEKLLLSGSKNADVELPLSLGGLECCVYRSETVILIKNTGTRTISLSGTPLPTGTSARLRRHQRLLLKKSSISHSDILFFLDAKYQQKSSRLYLSYQENNILAERNKTNLSTLRISFSLNITIEVLKPTKLRLPDQEKLLPGESIQTSNNNVLITPTGQTIELQNLRQKSISSGNRFKLGQQQQKCRISNQLEFGKKIDLPLTRGLANPLLLEITYQQETGTGELRILRNKKNIISINNQIVEKNEADQVHTLKNGYLIRLSSNQSVRCRFSEGVIEEECTLIHQLKVASLTHFFNKKTVALDNINFQIQRGEMLCIMGPSGCGKSTLLSVLAGQLAPSKGNILLNSTPLYHHLARLTPFITSMPQEEALSDQLSVKENLRYALQLRQPNLSRRENRKRVNTILDELSLQSLARRPVGSPDDKSLSGGERSRLNLGLDFGAKAEIFLFDEPIAGLSSKDSEHIVETLKSISLDKIVVASLHRPGGYVLSQFNKVLLLDKGGRIAFFGSPDNMTQYFLQASEELGIDLPTEDHEKSADFVFDVLETPLATRHKSTKFHSTRRFPPQFWQERFESHTLYQQFNNSTSSAHSNLQEVPRAEDNLPIPKKARHTLFGYWKIYQAHFLRSLLSKFRSKGTIYCTLLEAPLLALVIAWTLRASPEGSYQFSTGLHVVTYLFLSLTVGMFLGLTNSATEILRDRPTLRRERNYRFNSSLYVGAKFTTLSLLAALQCAIYITLGNWMLEIQGMWMVHWSWMLVTSLCGTAIALAISANVKTERAALSSVPLILVPQLLLAGTPLIPFHEMNRGMFSGAENSRNEGAEPILARFIPLRYAYEGLIVTQATANPFEQSRRRIHQSIQKLKQQADFLMSYKNQGLSEKEKNRLEILLSALTRISAAEADTAEQAIKKIKKLESVGHYGTMEDLRKIPIYSEKENPISCASYFINERAEGLVMQQDIQRLDLSKTDKPNIFLAEKKYYGSQLNPHYTYYQEQLTAEERTTIPAESIPEKKQARSWNTTTLCLAVLISLSVISLIIAVLSISRSTKKIT